MKRAIRRAHLVRMKTKARNLYKHDIQAKNANHLAVCSCCMCGNPRKWFNELTFQERKFGLVADWLCG